MILHVGHLSAISQQSNEVYVCDLFLLIKSRRKSISVVAHAHTLACAHTFSPPLPNVSIASFHTPSKKSLLNDIWWITSMWMSSFTLSRTFLYSHQLLVAWLHLPALGFHHTVKCGPQHLYFFNGRK